VTKNFKGQDYTLYKLFDAQNAANGATVSADGEISGITYTLMSGKQDLKADVPSNDGTETVNGSQWFSIDGNGRVTALPGLDFDDSFKAWAKAYGKSISTITANEDNANVKWDNLAAGYYFITTTTGSLVTVDSITPNVNVEDKNSIPSGDKTITDVEDGSSSIDEAGKKAIAQVGKKVTFTATVDFGKGSKNVKFHDAMGNGLALDEASIKVTGVGANDYEILETPDNGDTFTIKFVDGIAETVVATITYKATVTSNALTTTVAAGTNTATISYGENNTTTQEKTTQVYNAKFTVSKQDGDKKPLAGAGFVIQNSNDKYYKLSEDKKTVTWVDNIDDATEYSSNAQGEVTAFTGLGIGQYKLVEKTVPGGYNKVNDTGFEIKDNDYTTTNLEQGNTVINNKGTEMPSTGGIGTTIFYVVGGVMVAGAVVFLLTKRRASAAE
jgi:LPXTG-motif cell wall-anchored protein